MKTIMTAGKGGTGKSVVLANLLIHYILPHSNGNTLVVDADPHQSLSLLLAPQYRLDFPTSLGELRRQHGQTLRTGKGLEQASRSELADILVQQALVPLPGGALLAMGGNDQPGCQCVVNNLLGKALDALRERFDLAVVDNEAGVEHIGRHSGWPVDLLLLMTSPRALDMNVAGKILIHAQAVQRDIRHSILVINRYQSEYEKLHPAGLALTLPNTNLWLTLPYSQSLDATDRPDPEWISELQTLWDFVRQ